MDHLTDTTIHLTLPWSPAIMPNIAMQEVILERCLSHKAMFLSALLILFLLLSGQGIACIFPSQTEMRQDQAMACCAEQCRVKTTPEAAERACEQSRSIAFSQNQDITGPPAASVYISIKDLPDSDPFSLQNPSSFLPLPGFSSTEEYNLLQPYRSGKLYLLNRSLLI